MALHTWDRICTGTYYMRVSCVCVSSLSHVCIIYRYDVRMRRCICKCVCDKCNIINAPWAKLIFRCCLSVHGSKVKVNPMKRKHPSYPTDTACLEVDISRLGPDILVSGSSCEGTNLDSLPQWLGLWGFLKPSKACSFKQRVPPLQGQYLTYWPTKWAINTSNCWGSKMNKHRLLILQWHNFHTHPVESRI